METSLKHSFEKELASILDYWIKHTPDEINGGFYGAIDNDNQINEKAHKGSVLNARILWTFSAAFNHSKVPQYIKVAERSFKYIKDHFIDKQYGGVFWAVDYKGKPSDTKKQIYAIAFSIYGLVEYYKASGNTEALDLAVALYKDIEKHSFDMAKGGYLEAFSQDWQELGDLRLSDKDANEKKTMNTHLHILEAYTTLYRSWPDKGLNNQIRNLLSVFSDYIIDKKTNHLILFFDENWQAKSDIISYGHDIEASWLLLEAAEVLEDKLLIERFKIIAVGIAVASTEGLDKDGGMIYEYMADKNQYIKEKHWWVQAEAMVGFLSAFELTKKTEFYQFFLTLWDFTQKYIVDHKKGEWFWGIKQDYSLMPGKDKAGFWKCPYHNSRACMEILKRFPKILKLNS